MLRVSHRGDKKPATYTDAINKQKIFIERDVPEWPFSDWLISANARDENDKVVTVSVTKKTVNGKKGIEVDLSGTGLDTTKQSIDLDIVYRSLEGEYTGDATVNPNIFIAVGLPRSVKSKNKTVAHEFGHGIGMVPVSGHDLQYSNANGGQGSHCRYGATPNKKSKAQGGVFNNKYESGECVMYHASSEHYKFCPTCKEFVKEADLSEDAMKVRKWG